MTFTVEDLAPLKEALLSGAKQVSVSGRLVVFQDLSELKKLIAEIEAKIKADTATEEGTVLTKSPSVIQGRFSPNKKLY